jgi:hypothetical protein
VWAGPSPSAIARNSLWQSCIFLELHTGEQHGNVLKGNEKIQYVVSFIS